MTATRQSAPVPTQSLCACRAERSAGVRLIVCTRARTDYDDFDEMVNPVENFYEFAVGGWRKRNPIPPEYPSWNCFTILHDLNQKRLKEMVDELLDFLYHYLKGYALCHRPLLTSRGCHLGGSVLLF